jgi:hypothetical protein
MIAEGRGKHRVGELRPSQFLHTFGVGAVVDLPNISAMVLGLDDWSLSGATEIGEERLLEAVRELLGSQVERLLSPPRQVEDGPTSNPFGGTTTGVPVAPFPRWMVCPYCRLLAPLDSGLFQLKVDRFQPDRSRYEHGNCRKPGRPPTVLPARFLVACQGGHLDEFPWQYFVHKGQPGCSGRLTLTEYGGLGDAAAIQVRCEACGAHRPMSDAFGEEAAAALPRCRGRHPHLRDFDEQPCDEPLKTILLGASNSWFGLSLTALAVPRTVDRLGQLIDAGWHIYEKATDQAIIPFLRSIGQLAHLDSYDDAAIWAAVERKRAGEGVAPEDGENLKVPEWRAFTAPSGAPILPDFKLVEVPPPPRYADILERVVQVERVREVSALIGFTRIASPGDFSDTIELPSEWRAPLTRRAPGWVPAAEVHGEGIFLQFAESAIGAWLGRDREIIAQDDAFMHAHRQWRRSRGLEPDHGYPGLRYVFLHTFAHALIRQLALECGYSMASIRERIYALPPTEPNGPMAGVLLYTAASDSEGTLGGLVSLGHPDKLGRHIDDALEAMYLCASDPHCAEHRVGSDNHALHAACCHACLFMPETSCERGNKYLDRTVLVPTIERAALAFFGIPR